MYARIFRSISLVVILSVILPNAASAVDPDLIGWWPLNEGAGDTAFDLSASGNNGTIRNATSGGLGDGGSVWFDDPERGMVISFNGDDASGALVNTDLIIPAMTMDNGFSWAFWAKQHPDQETNNDTILGNRYGGTTSPLQFIKFTPTRFEFFNEDYDYLEAVNYDPIPGDVWVHHVVSKDGPNLTYYRNGVESGTNTITKTIDENPFFMGGDGQNNAELWQGYLSDVRLYTRPLSAGEVLGVMQGASGVWPYASAPDPADGALLEATWANISWRAGGYAVSHDVYLGESFDDVNDATVDSPVFRGNQSDPYIIAGFVGYPYPDGLAPGTTYYWRIDEVNDSEPNSPWKGDVWSFSIPPKTAYNPSVPDGAMFVDPNVELSWASGYGAKLHAVYFGDDLDTVANATDGAPQSDTTFVPGPLELNKTYYWRVDELEVPLTHKGEVWSFTTTLPSLGKAVASRWENIATTDINTLKTNPNYPDNPDVTEEVTEFLWNGEDLSDYGGRIEAWLYVPSTGNFTFWLNTDDQGELWLSTDDDPGNAQLIAQESSWAAFGTWGSGEEKSDEIPLIGGRKYYIMAIWKEEAGGDHCQVAWQGPGVPERTVIAGSYLSPFEPLKAYGADPSNNAAGVTQVPILTWKPGLEAASHEVYFGTDEQAVADATKASPEYKGSRQLGDESYDPGKLEWFTDYYWRVDEIDNTNPDSPWPGTVWSFTTADFLIVDDFESYDNIDPPAGEPGANRIFDKWVDGFGTMTNGAQVGNLLPPYAEQTIVHSGDQSMNYSYDNAGKTSEATLTLEYPRDWTEQDVTKLSLWFQGDAANAADRIFVALNANAVVYNDDASATQTADWTPWVIDLQKFADQGVNLTNVNTITIGIGTKNAPSPNGGTGTVYFDDIRLIR